MMVRAGANALAAFLVLAPATVFGGDGSFGIPASGILMPPPPQARTASLIPPERADLEKQRPAARVQQTYSPAPADGAGRSRVVPPSEAPVHSPIVVPPKKKQFKAPLASVDPSYVERIAAVGPSAPAPVSAPVPVAPPVMAQGGEPKRGLFTSQTFRNRSAASAAYEEHALRSAPRQMAAAPQAVPRSGPANARIARDGTPCAQLRGIFTSPAECR